MAENPATWGRAEKIISDTLDKAQAAHEAGMCGWSTPMQIAEALRTAGLLLPKDPDEAKQKFLKRLNLDARSGYYTRCKTCNSKEFTIRDDEFVCADCGDILM